MNFEDHRRLASHHDRCHVLPRKRSTTGWQMKVEPQRIHPESSGGFLTSASAEVVMGVDERHHVHDGLYELHERASAKVCADVGVPEVQADPDAF